jgi:predicted Rossmann fold nucleotide-binding protein DprA/Smf involved in DNA uptake
VSGGGAGEVRPDPDRSGALVLEALGFTPATLDQLAERLGEPLGPVAVQLQRLAEAGWIAREGSWWHRLP